MVSTYFDLYHILCMIHKYIEVWETKIIHYLTRNKMKNIVVSLQMIREKKKVRRVIKNYTKSKPEAHRAAVAKYQQNHVETHRSSLAQYEKIGMGTEH